MHNKLTKAPPKILAKLINLEILWLYQFQDTTIKPYPPIFNNTAARIIEPPTGASTWALGSHRWAKYTGNFTKKAVVKKVNCSFKELLKRGLQA
jgi:hypothetical protein